MPRKASPDQASLPFDGFAQPVVEPESVAEPESELDRPRRGRPRKWASEAERKRAYRERKAADFAEPERLRRELRAARKRLSARDEKIAQADAELAESRRELAAELEQHVALESRIKYLEERVDYWRSDASRLRKQRDDALRREPPTRLNRPISSPPGTAELRLPRFNPPPDRTTD